MLQCVSPAVCSAGRPPAIRIDVEATATPARSGGSRKKRGRRRGAAATAGGGAASTGSLPTIEGPPSPYAVSPQPSPTRQPRRIIDAGAGAMAPLVVAAPPSPTRKPRRLPELAGVRS